MANKYLKFEYWNTCDLGNIYYQGGQHFWFYLDGDVLEPFHEETEDGQENGEGDFIATSRRDVKRYRIRTSLISEFLVDAMQRMKLHDNIELTFKTGEIEQIYNVDIEIEWQFEKHNYQATAVITFDMDEKVLIGACCDNLTVTPAVIVEQNTIITGRAFYVSNDGNDANDGQTELTAWQTLTKVQSSSFEPEDCIVFNRGDTFRGSLYRDAESGSVGLPITFGCYGTGAKPKILGSKDLSLTGDWEVHAGNVWKTTATLGILQDDISNLVFNNEATCGVKVIALVDVDTQGYFFYNRADNLVYIYSASNPATYYTHIEACGHYDINQALIMINNCDYVTVECLDVRYSSAAGIEFKNAENGIIQYNEVSWIGGEYLDPDVDATRLGNGLSVTLNSSNIIIRYNKVSQCFDAGISPQGWGTYTLQNISIYYNIVNYCHYSYEVWAGATGTHINTNFYNNTCVNAGYGWGTSMLQRPDADLGNNCHVMIWTTVGTVTNCNIKNNIFSIARERGLIIGFTASPLKFLMDNNIYDEFTTFAQNEDTDVVYDDLAEWQAASGRDASSLYADPIFIGAADFRLSAGSPAIGAGVDVGLTEDYNGETVGDPPEIGAYEYV